MKATLKEIYSFDYDLESYQPKKRDNFSVWLRAMIGLEGKDGSDSFDILVCTPTWLLENITGPKWGFKMLIVTEYDFPKIRETIENYCRSCEGKDWETIAGLLSRIGHWEFENYRQ